MAKKELQGSEFSGIEQKLRTADELIDAHKKNVEKVLDESISGSSTPEELHAMLMATFNAAIRSFKELDKDLARSMHKAKEQMRREKDRVITKIYER